MAFVIDRTEKKSIFEPLDEVYLAPGPGSYSVEPSRHRAQQCAPFNSSIQKKSQFEVPESKSGPGYYDPKYYKDVNKTLHRATNNYVFASRVERFAGESSPQTANKQKPHNNASLHASSLDQSSSMVELKNKATYYTESNEQRAHTSKQNYEAKLHKSKSLMKEIRQHNHENRVESIKGKREFIRVILTSTTNTENIESRYIYKHINGKTIGPGSYDTSYHTKGKKASRWSLDKQSRFKSEPSQAPGPGAYELDAATGKQMQPSLSHHSRNKERRLTSSFASSVIRSHMDTLIYNTNIPIKAAILEDKNIKDSRPGPGAYHPSDSIHNKTSFNYGREVGFGSTAKDGSGEAQVPGPGAYDVNKYGLTLRAKRSECNETIRQMRNKIFSRKARITDNFDKNNSLSRLYMRRLNTEQAGSDPCFVQPVEVSQRKNKRITKFCSLEERCFSRLGNLSQEQRFKNPTTKEGTVPGPGEYHNENSGSDFRAATHKKTCSSVFKSEIGRKVFEHEKKPGLPFYNVSKEDIGYKAEKLKKYLENLKRINVVRTPFYSSTTRFEPLELTGSVPEPPNPERSPRAHPSPPPQPSSTFKSGTRREVFNAAPAPGPGQYTLKVKTDGAPSSLEKKSFNKNYGCVSRVQQVDEPGNDNAVVRKNSLHRGRPG